MVVCKFFQSGNCRYGRNCKYEHRYENDTSNNNNNNNNNRQGYSSGGVFGNPSKPEKWNLNMDDIKNDLTNTKPSWILSAYGPGKETPATLFAENEFSPEELRCRFYQQRETGPVQAEEADKEAIRLWTKAANDMASVANKVDDVLRFMEQKEKEHPNRYDFCRMDGKTTREEFEKNAQINAQPAWSANPFGGTTRATTTTNPFSKPAFGQSAFQAGSSQPPSAFGQPAQASAFGKPAFGAPAFGQPSTSASGTTSATASSAFGKPPVSGSGFGQTGFGQTAQPATSGFGQTGFGQPAQPVASGFGQQAQGGSAFGQTSNPGQSSANPFAKPTAASGFSTTGTGTSAFGKPAFGQPGGSGFPSAGTGPSAFGQPSFGKPTAPGPSPFGHAAPAPAFGQTGFGQTQQQNKPQTGFGGGASPGFGQQSQQSGFGQGTQQQQGFGTGFGQDAQQQQQSATQPGFGTGLGQKASTNPSPFGQPPRNQPSASPFGTSPFGQTDSQRPSPFGQPQSGPIDPFGKTSTTQPPPPNQPDFGQPQAIAPQQRPSAPTNGSQPTTSTTKPTSAAIQPLHYTQTLPTAPTTFTPNGELTAFRACPVSYRRIEEPTMEGEIRLKEVVPRYQRPDNGKFERIWFPRGVNENSVQTLLRVTFDVQAEEVEYTDEVKRMYGCLFENGRFEGGKVPLVPPMQGWVDRDF
ncbi:hypothetical protein H2198_005533 [Neophaeococcomyces mojaviensis]|uniref:Uncharacterized protein n=1 Tax=Neophaeococcomyces mojaviensis TaxID=3383035 RepID=A0ACC3A5K4_9EURO|nr:hypothetical protein H2198_005533 [Knufia sp. JES_112]